jgi:hypothetical protein
MKATILIAAVTALTLAAVGSADARLKHKRYRVVHHLPPAVAYVPADTMVRGRPAWAQPGQCFEDQGYGRYIPCGSAPSAR